MNLIQKYNSALNDIYEHVGFKEDWVVCPVVDFTNYYWQVDNEENDEVVYANSLKDLLNKEAGNYYSDDIYKQRFYKKWVYRGKEFTMIMCDPHVDDVKWFKIFSNKKEIK